MDYTALKNELINDPETIGYSSPVDWFDQAASEADAALLNTANRPADVETLSGSQLFEAIDNDEYDLLSADAKAKVQLVVSLGDNIQIAPSTKARAMLAAALTGATASLAALAALGSKNISRAEELGLGTVTYGDVQTARKHG